MRELVCDECRVTKRICGPHESNTCDGCGREMDLLAADHPPAPASKTAFDKARKTAQNWMDGYRTLFVIMQPNKGVDEALANTTDPVAIMAKYILSLSQPANAETLLCGHPASLLVKSVESDYKFCELCESRSRQADGERRERELVTERDHWKSKYEQESNDHYETLSERDHAQDVADFLTSKILNEPIDWADHCEKWDEAKEAVSQLADSWKQTIFELRTEVADLRNQLGTLDLHDREEKAT